MTENVWNTVPKSLRWHATCLLATVRANSADRKPSVETRAAASSRDQKVNEHKYLLLRDGNPIAEGVSVLEVNNVVLRDARAHRKSGSEPGIYAAICKGMPVKVGFVLGSQIKWIEP